VVALVVVRQAAAVSEAVHLHAAAALAAAVRHAVHLAVAVQALAAGTNSNFIIYIYHH